MRFAWLREKAAKEGGEEETARNRQILIAYNAIWWVPILLPFINVIDYSTGFIAFAIITIIRAGANLYRNNVLSPEEGEFFPLRSP